MLQALGWLALFLPTHGLRRGEGGWNETVADWMLLWESDAHNSFWSGQWMLMIAQIAKHDTQGMHQHIHQTELCRSIMLP